MAQDFVTFQVRAINNPLFMEITNEMITAGERLGHSIKITLQNATVKFGIVFPRHAQYKRIDSKHKSVVSSIAIMQCGSDIYYRKVEYKS